MVFSRVLILTRVSARLRALVDEVQSQRARLSDLEDQAGQCGGITGRTEKSTAAKPSQSRSARLFGEAGHQ